MNIKDTQDKKFALYCHQNLINSKRYIGITCQLLNSRWRNGKGYRNSPHFNSAIQKYGWENFSHEVLFTDLSKEEAEAKEVELINKYHTRDNRYGYNIAAGGSVMCGEDNPWYGQKHSEESKRKMSEKRKGIPKSEEFKQMLSQKLKGRKFSEETRQKMRENHADFKGKNHPRYGISPPKEHMERMCKLSKTPEAIAKMKAHKVWYSGAKNPNAKTVMCLETGKIYGTMKEAAEDTGCNASKISAVCHGKRKHTNHLTFKIVEEKNDELV